MVWQDTISDDVIEVITKQRGTGIFRRASINKDQSIEKLKLGKKELAIIAADLDALVKKSNPDAGIHIIDVENCKTINDIVNAVIEAISPNPV